MAYTAKKPVHGVIDHLVFGEIKDTIVPDLKDLDELKLLDRASERMPKRGVLHRVGDRDISLRNILLSKGEPESGERHGLLIDLDYADHRLSKGVAAACHRAGTFPFMAIDILITLEEVEHRYDHDLESVLYILCYICCTSAGPNGLRRENFDLNASLLGSWFRRAPYTAFDKLGCVHGAGFKHIIGYFDPYFRDKSLEKCMNDLRALLFTSSGLRRVDRENLRDSNGHLPIKFIAIAEREPPDFFAEYKRILREAYANVVEQQPNISPAPTPSCTNISTLGRAEDMLRDIDIPNQRMIEAALEGGDAEPAPMPAIANPIKNSGVDLGSASTIGVKRKPAEKPMTVLLLDGTVSRSTKRPRMQEPSPMQQPSHPETEADSSIGQESVTGSSPAARPLPTDAPNANSIGKEPVAGPSWTTRLRPRRNCANSQTSGSKDVGSRTRPKAKSLSTARDEARVVYLYLTRSKAKEMEQEAAR